MSIPGAQALRGAGQQFMGEGAGRALTGLGRLFMPGAMASQNVRQGDYGAAGVDLGLDMLPLGGLVGRGLRKGGAMIGGLPKGAADFVNRFKYPHRTPYGYNYGGMLDPAEYTSPVRQAVPGGRGWSDRFVVGRRNVGTGDMPRMYATDQYGLNFRPVDYFSASGSPQRKPGGGTNYGGSMIPGDQAFMDMLNARYTFPTGTAVTGTEGRSIPQSVARAMTRPENIAEAQGAGRWLNTLRATNPISSGKPAMSAVDLNRMVGMSPQFQRQNLSGAGFRSVVPPPSAIPDTRGMSRGAQAMTGAGLVTMPGNVRMAQDVIGGEEGFQQRPDLAGQLRRNVRARGGATGRRGRRTGDTGG